MWWCANSQPSRTPMEAARRLRPNDPTSRLACQSAPRDFAIELGADMMLADAFLDPDVPEQSFFQVREEASLASRAAYQLREQSCVIGHLQCVVRLLEPGRRPGG